MPQLNIQVGGNASGFFATLNQVRAASARLNTQIGAQAGNSLKGQVMAFAGGFGIAALTQKTLEYAGRINDLSERLGISTDALQEFDYAARQNGASLEEMTGAMQRLAVSRQEALDNPRSDPARAFAALGISVQQLKNARLEDLFRGVSRAVKDAANPQQVLSEAIAVMGRGAPGVFAAMRSGLSESADEAHRLGLIMQNEVIRALDDVGDRLAATQQRLTTSFASTLLTILNGIQEVIDRIQILAAMAGGMSAVNIDPTMGERISPLGPARWAQRVAREIAEAASQAGVDAEKQMRARDAALDARRRNRSGMGGGDAFGGRGDQRVKDAEEIERIEQRIAKMRRDNLPPDERRLAIEREIEEAMRRARALQERQDFGAAEKKALLHEEERILQLENELEGVKAAKQAGGGNADRFTKIGVFSQRLTGSVPRTKDPAQAIEAQKPILLKMLDAAGKNLDVQQDIRNALV